MPNFYIKLFFHPIAGFNGNQKEDHDPESEMASKVLDPANPVFKERNASSKIQTVIEKLNEVRDNYTETGVMEKAVIVSQWTSMLNVLKIRASDMLTICLFLCKALDVFFTATTTHIVEKQQ